MAPRPKPWFRFYVETVHDPKIRRLKPADRWLWVVVLACARASAIPGELLVSNTDPMQLRDISDAAAMQRPAVKRGLDALEKAGLIDQAGTVAGAWHVSKWAERQFESDHSVERVAALRQRRSNGDATAMQRPPITETETELEGNSSLDSLTRPRPRPVENNASQSKAADPKCVSCNGTGTRYHATAGRDAPCECTKRLAPTTQEATA